jgi:hypothetical protein
MQLTPTELQNHYCLGGGGRGGGVAQRIDLFLNNFGNIAKTTPQLHQNHAHLLSAYTR